VTRFLVSDKPRVGAVGRWASPDALMVMAGIVGGEFTTHTTLTAPAVLGPRYWASNRDYRTGFCATGRSFLRGCQAGPPSSHWLSVSCWTSVPSFRITKISP
jgi:hypothetical protein